MAARPDEAIAEFGKRHGYSPERAEREAERLIASAVDDALVGTPRFDILPHELESIARLRYEDRLRAGDGAPGVERFVGSSGARR